MIVMSHINTSNFEEPNTSELCKLTLQKLAVIFHSSPLWQPVLDIHYPLLIKHMVSGNMLATPRSIGEIANVLCGEVLLVIRAFELYRGWVNEDLVLSFVHDR